MSNASVVVLGAEQAAPQEVPAILHFMAAPPAPAIEVVTLERAVVEKVLADLEAGDPIALTADGRLVPYLRLMLAEPKRELWAMHSVGPGEVWPMLSKEHAEENAQATKDRCAEIAERKGWELGPIVINVVPSPFEPAEHFEMLAEESERERERFRKLAINYHKQRDELSAAVATLLKECRDTPAALAVKQLMEKPTRKKPDEQP